MAVAHAVKASIHSDAGHHDDAFAEITVALRLDPESYEVNRIAGYVHYRKRRTDAETHYEDKSPQPTPNEAALPDAVAPLREAGSGRPTKKERREMQKFRDED